MTEFFSDLWEGLRIDGALDRIRPFITDYPVETGAGILLILLLLIAGVFIRRMKKRTRVIPETDGAPAPAAAEESDGIPYSPPSSAGGPMEDVAPGVYEAAGPPSEQTAAGLMGRLKSGLQKTRRSIAGRLESILSEGGATDPETLEEIEETLITSDVGVDTTMALIEEIHQNASTIQGPQELRHFLKERMKKLLTRPRDMDISATPYVIMVVGVNGVGKTTTIGKLAHRFRSQGKSVLIGAANTFRAAAVEQLEIWTKRSGADFVRHRENADPAAVAFDAVQAGISRNVDIVIIDTAGRLQTKVNLMEQLKKIRRSITKKMPEAPHEVLLVLDATTGQNAISQAKLFHEGIGVTSLALTKLDGTAKGGIVVGICNTMQLPLQYIGVGEQMDDLQPFDPDAFIEAIF